jgi:hypothetical protein
VFYSASPSPPFLSIAGTITTPEAHPRKLNRENGKTRDDRQLRVLDQPGTHARRAGQESSVSKSRVSWQLSCSHGQVLLSTV